MLQDQIDETHKILDRAFETYNPSTMIACYSGGYDSMVMSHIALRWAKEHRIVLLVNAVDTLLSADGWRDYVTMSARAIGADMFDIWDNPGLDLWQKDVKEKGFVYRKKQHHIYFYYLKQRVFRMMLAKYKTHRFDHVMFLNGIRRAESPDRRNAPEVEKRGSAVFVNPILYWSNDEVLRYRTDHELPTNPFYDLFGNSGDCLCNWHNQIRLKAVEEHAPNLFQVIKPLDQQNRDNFGYGYDEEPTQEPDPNQLRLFDWDTECTPNLCAGCSKPGPTNEMLDYIQLQRMEW